MRKNLSVRQAEILTSRKSPAKSSAKRVTQDAHLRSLEEKLQHALGTKVRVFHGKKRGRLEIEYYSLEDLDRVLKVLGIKS